MYTFILCVAVSCYWKINLIWFDDDDCHQTSFLITCEVLVRMLITCAPAIPTKQMPFSSRLCLCVYLSTQKLGKTTNQNSVQLGANMVLSTVIRFRWRWPSTFAIHRVSKKTSTHTVAYKLRNSCLILIIFDTKIPDIIWHRTTA